MAYVASSDYRLSLFRNTLTQGLTVPLLESRHGAFIRWRSAVEACLRLRHACTSHDLRHPYTLYIDLYHQRLTPNQAAAEAVRLAGESRLFHPRRLNP